MNEHLRALTIIAVYLFLLAYVAGLFGALFVAGEPVHKLCPPHYWALCIR